MYYKWQMSILCTDYATYSICPFSAWLGPVWNGHFPKPARANQKPAQLARRLPAYGYSPYIFTIGYSAILYEYGKLYDKVIKVLSSKNYGRVIHRNSTAENAHLCVFSSWMVILWMTFSFLWCGRKLSFLNYLIHMNVVKLLCNHNVLVMPFGSIDL